jgi:hypothetical protein
MPKRRTLVCLALALVAIGVGIYLCWPRSPRFSEEQFDRIQEGMTQPEVEAVLGCPPGNYTGNNRLLTSLPIRSEFGLSSLRISPTGNFKEWVADTPEPLFTDEHGPSRQRALGISLNFSDDGKMKGKYHATYTYTPPSLLERLRAWVGW